MQIKCKLEICAQHHSSQSLIIISVLTRTMCHNDLRIWYIVKEFSMQRALNRRGLIIHSPHVIEHILLQPLTTPRSPLVREDLRWPYGPRNSSNFNILSWKETRMITRYVSLYTVLSDIKDLISTLARLQQQLQPSITLQAPSKLNHSAPQ